MIKRGDMVWVDLEPVRGHEANKRRPAVVVSNDRANAAAARHGRGVVTVVPITSNVTKVFPFQVRLAKGTGGLGTDSKAQAEQMRAVDVERLGPVIGSLPRSVVAKLDDALRLQLDLLDQ